MDTLFALTTENVGKKRPKRPNPPLLTRVEVEGARIQILTAQKVLVHSVGAYTIQLWGAKAKTKPKRVLSSLIIPETHKILLRPGNGKRV